MGTGQALSQRTNRLVVPGEILLRVLRERRVVRRVHEQKIIRPHRRLLKRMVRKLPTRQRHLISAEIQRIVNGFVAPERHVELVLAIEAAQTVEAGAVQVIEQPSRFRPQVPLLPDKLVEAGARFVKSDFLVSQIFFDAQAALQALVEINDVLVEVGQVRPLGQ